MQTKAKGPRRLISRDELQRRIPYSMTHIWRLEQQGDFPKRITLGEGRVAWDSDAVATWIEDRIRAGRKLPGPRAKRTPPADGGDST
jgi:prophage regulatory protein